MSFRIIPTSNFEKELKLLAKKYPGIKKDIEDLKKDLEKNPQQGAALSKGCYKIRMK